MASGVKFVPWKSDLSLREKLRTTCVQKWEMGRERRVAERYPALVCLDEAKQPVEVSAEVVRFTESEGFAVKFPDLDVLRTILARISELSQKPD